MSTGSQRDWGSGSGSSSTRGLGTLALGASSPSVVLDRRGCTVHETRTVGHPIDDLQFVGRERVHLHAADAQRVW